MKKTLYTYDVYASKSTIDFVCWNKFDHRIGWRKTEEAAMTFAAQLLKGPPEYHTVAVSRRMREPGDFSN